MPAPSNTHVDMLGSALHHYVVNQYRIAARSYQRLLVACVRAVRRRVPGGSRSGRESLATGEGRDGQHGCGW